MTTLTTLTSRGIYERLCEAKQARQSITHDPIPPYDQLTEYVCQADVVDEAKGVRVRVAVMKVEQKDDVGEWDIAEVGPVAKETSR